MHFLAKPNDELTLRFFYQVYIANEKGELKDGTIWWDKQREILMEKLIGETDQIKGHLLRGALWLMDDLKEVIISSKDELNRRT
jgi:hypothetical protein